MTTIPRLGEYPARMSLRLRPEDKHRLEEFAYRARRHKGYVLQHALDLYEAELEANQANETSSTKPPAVNARPRTKTAPAIKDHDGSSQ